MTVVQRLVGNKECVLHLCHVDAAVRVEKEGDTQDAVIFGVAVGSVVGAAGGAHPLSTAKAAAAAAMLRTVIHQGSLAITAPVKDLRGDFGKWHPVPIRSMDDRE
ncbi:hypothetical protein [Paenarthrobacter sp. PH39-S1]|uniref:hypothetical protein n=1 Tax=Paenarthrobacter sp. PH39-S1 TaxID=3046204 RepID=UPI0024BBCDE3|nr:hypothetical protein [Paenarthrobacter sp. PH39-S1]MDJ0358478.1 hypothetical protein [Paenarthrobacter sp. PH39-S1]